MGRFHRAAFAALALWLVAPAAAPADQVVPAERVRSRVLVREQGDRASRPVGSLRPGDEAELLGSVPGWHEVRLADRTHGFVSASWTRVVPVEPERPVERFTLEAAYVPKGPVARFVDLLRTTVLAPFTNAARVDFLLQAPEAGRSERRHSDPNLPVAGLAAPPGSTGHFDIVLAIDLSPSTNEFAEADVDGDGVAEDAWKGSDSILKAQVAAALGFVRTLRRLPGNHQGQRIRVGVVTFAGDERFHLRPEDRKFELSVGSLLELAYRDAEVPAPLTRDYALLERKLLALAEAEPRGMTDFAAGIGRALVELMRGSEPEDERLHGATRVIHFMTDGKPRLPYDPERAEKVAFYAARMAAESGVRINGFALGRDVVTRKPSRALQRVARETGGRFIELENPRDIIPILRTTSFAFVDRVKLVNRTTQVETGYVTTGIDGSFYGEVPLETGENQIEVVAVLHDGREAQAGLQVDYARVPPSVMLAERLEAVRRENQALIEQIKEQLAKRIEEARAAGDGERQRRELELLLEGDASR